MQNKKIIIGFIMVLIAAVAFFAFLNLMSETSELNGKKDANGDPITARPHLKVATADFPPFKFMKDGEIVGLDMEIVSAVYDRMGYDISVEMLPFKRADQATRNGDYVSYFTFTKSDSRAEAYYFSDPLSAVQEFFFYDTYRVGDPRVQKVRDWESLDFLEGLEVGVSENYNYSPAFMKLWRPAGFPQWNPDEEGFVRMFNTQEVTSEANEKQHLINLVEGRIHTFISDISVGNYYREQDLDRFGSVTNAKKPTTEVRTFHMGFSKNWRGPNGESALDIRDDFNTELAKFIKEGGRLPIYKKYGFVSPFIPKTNEIKSD